MSAKPQRPQSKPTTRHRPKPRNSRDFLELDENAEIDEEAGRIFSRAIPRSWVDNTLKKDYGKDHHIELTVPIIWGKGGKRRKTKKVTGKTIYVQRKGVNGATLRHGGKFVVCRLERRHLTYWADEVPLPVFLVVVDIRAEKCYWLFLQEYLLNNQNWRRPGPSTVYIPIENELSAALPRFESEIDRAINYTNALRTKSPLDVESLVTFSRTSIPLRDTITRMYGQRIATLMFKGDIADLNEKDEWEEVVRSLGVVGIKDTATLGRQLLAHRQELVNLIQRAPNNHPVMGVPVFYRNIAYVFNQLALVIAAARNEDRQAIRDMTKLVYPQPNQVYLLFDPEADVNRIRKLLGIKLVARSEETSE